MHLQDLRVVRGSFCSGQCLFKAQSISDRLLKVRASRSLDDQRRRTERVTTTQDKSTNGTAESAESAMSPSTTHTGEVARHHERQRRVMSPFEAMMADMERFFVNPSAWFPFARVPRGLAAVHIPRVDVVEKDKSLIVTAELPGVKKEDVHVEVEDGALVIHGETHSEHEDREHDHVRLERSYGSFYRRLPMDFDVEPQQITATLKDGVLEVRIPEPPEPKDKKEAQIPISSG
jgi:HSP20 family protein